MRFIAKYHKIYHSSNRKTKSEIIRLISKALGYHPKYTTRLLNDFNISQDKGYKIIGRGRKPKYKPIKQIITDLWVELGCIWSERLKEFIYENMRWISLKYQINQSDIELLNSISPSTIDRIVKE
jgi:hypothetical protein